MVLKIPNYLGSVQVKKDNSKMISHAKIMIKRLTGKELLDKKRTLASVSTNRIAKVCGYYSMTESGQVRVNLTDFHNALLKAKKTDILFPSGETQQSNFHEKAKSLEQIQELTKKEKLPPRNGARLLKLAGIVKDAPTDASVNPAHRV